MFIEILRLTGPDIVPDANRSPGRILHPFTAWCVNCCFMVQYVFMKFDLHTTLGLAPSG